ncbi:hypothetical protein ACEPPN_019264 [Leptodophora sp. 'Broadleaf-Isolate-01']
MPEKSVDCMMCMSDDVPQSKSAKLNCGHRMCNSCLKRMFRLSLQDPTHSNPTCCSKAIPIGPLELLFDNDFKERWNRKFQEFQTKTHTSAPKRWLDSAPAPWTMAKKFKEIMKFTSSLAGNHAEAKRIPSQNSLCTQDRGQGSTHIENSTSIEHGKPS